MDTEQISLNRLNRNSESWGTAQDQLHKYVFKAKMVRAFSYIFHLPFGGILIFLIKYGFKIRIRDLQGLRAYYKELFKDPRPLIICSNHLSYLDPVMIIYSFGHHLWYLTHYKSYSWNFPAIEYSKNFLFRLICHLSKCIFINRSGSVRHHQTVLDLGRRLVQNGEALTIFPEGRRSKTGTFEDQKLAYGVGKIISGMKECRVLCVYVRAVNRKMPCRIPKRGPIFSVTHRMLEFQPTGNSREEVGRITRNIADQIILLEKEFFLKSDLSRVSGGL